MNEDHSFQNPATGDTGVSRRRLMRAGLSAAPVLAALKSNTVLAGGNSCIRPSAFSSLTAAHMKVSQGRVIADDFECASPDRWKTRDAGLPRNFKTTTLFISNITGFYANPGARYANKTLQQVLESTGHQGDERLARYVLAAFLSAKSVNNHPSAVLLSQRQCREIWNRQGNWSPFAGATWTLPMTLAYFDAIFGPAFL